MHMLLLIVFKVYKKKILCMRCQNWKKSFSKAAEYVKPHYCAGYVKKLYLAA